MLDRMSLLNDSVVRSHGRRISPLGTQCGADTDNSNNTDFIATPSTLQPFFSFLSLKYGMHKYLQGGKILP